jgi:hypothetical protein
MAGPVHRETAAGRVDPEVKEGGEEVQEEEVPVVAPLVAVPEVGEVPVAAVVPEAEVVPEAAAVPGAEVVLVETDKAMSV